MQRSREARLGRLERRVGAAEAAAQWEAEGAAERRRVLEANAAVGAAVRSWLTEMGIDPARAVILRVADAAAAELAAMPAGEASRPAGGRRPERRRAVPRDEDCDAATRRLINRYRTGSLPDPDLARASLAELFAWCIARRGGAGTTGGREVCC